MSDEERRMKEHSAGIDRDQRKLEKKQGEIMKLLLLGAGESGKTTVLKQMEIIYGTGFSDERKINFWLPRIRQNIIVAMRAICTAVDEKGLTDMVEATTEFEEFLSDETLGSYGHDIDMEEVGPKMQQLWMDPGVQKAWELRADYQVIESHVKYFERLDEISDPDYIPTTDDVLLCRSRTVGIVETHLMIDNQEYHIYDVGGQRNERRKWIHCFSDVTSVLFVAGISEFDQVLFEDKDQNRIVEAIELFSQFVTQVTFEESSMILFLNKRDLFEEKIKTKPINSVKLWEDYSGAQYDNNLPPEHGNNRKAVADGQEYFYMKFIPEEIRGLGPNMRRKGLFKHFTCATDTENMKPIVDACKETILKQSLEESGFM